MFQGLSLDQAPPFEAPLLFFCLALLFGISASLALFFQVNFYALLHLFTLGVMANIMFGALLQMLPVVIGVKFEKPKLFASIIATFLAVGAVSLFLSLTYIPKLFFVALFSLFVAVGGFSIALFYKLLFAPKSTPTLWGMKFAILSLFLTFILGSHLLLSIGIGELNTHFDKIIKTHGLFGVIGWIGLLIISITFQVIPMFYVAKELSQKIRYTLIFTIFFLLLLSPFFQIALIGLCLLLALYALLMLFQLFQRKRKVYEASTPFWYMGFFSLLAATLYGTLFEIESYPFALLYGYGFVLSIINAMLYKIIPFLAWFHISSWGFFDIPTMREMIDERLAKVQFAFYLITFITLFFSTQIAAIFMLLNFLFLGSLLLKPIKLYFLYKNKPKPFG